LKEDKEKQHIVKVKLCATLMVEHIFILWTSKALISEYLPQNESICNFV